MTILLISTIISVWEPLIIDKHWPELIQCIKLALNDADSETRANARQTFECLQNQYSAKADALFHVIILIIRKTYFWPKKDFYSRFILYFQELEPAKQRILAGRSSTASSTHSINSERDNLPNPNRGLYNAQNCEFILTIFFLI